MMMMMIYRKSFWNQVVQWSSGPIEQ